MDKDQVKERGEEGKIKEVAGQVVDHEKPEEKGKIQGTVSEAQTKCDAVKHDVKESKKSVETHYLFMDGSR